MTDKNSYESIKEDAINLINGLVGGALFGVALIGLAIIILLYLYS